MRESKMTMSAIRKSSPVPETTKSKLMNRSEKMIGINTQQMGASIVLNLMSSSINSMPNSTSFSFKKNEVETSEIKDKMSSDEQITSRTSLQSTCEKTANNPFPFQTKTHSLENGNNIYRKRSLENGNSQIPVVQKVFAKELIPPISYECLTKDGTINAQYLTNRTKKDEQLSHISSSENGKLPKQGFVNKKPGLFLKKSIENIYNKKNSNPSIVNHSSSSFQHCRRKQKKPIKNIWCPSEQAMISETADKVNVHDNNSSLNGKATEVQYRNLTKPVVDNTSKKPICSLNYGAPGKFGSNNTNVIIQCVRNTKSNVLHPPGSNSHAMQPVYCQMPSMPNQRSVALYSRCRYPVPQFYRQVGTATRSNAGNIFPQQIRMRCPVTVNTAQANGIPLIAGSASTATGIQHNLKSFIVANEFKTGNFSLHTSDQTGFQNQVRLSAEPVQISKISNQRILTVPQTASKSNAPARGYGNRNVRGNQTSVQETFNQEIRTENTGDKIQQTRRIFSKISLLLRLINRKFANGFEYPGSEFSLPIWKSELEQCILSAEKIKRVLSEYQEMKK